MTRIAVGGFLHETNTFAPTKATYADFVHGGGWPAMTHGSDVLKVMRQLADAGMTMVVVTHEIGFAREVADRVLFCDGGVVVEQGAAREVLNHPQHARTQDFLRRVLHPM